MTLMYTTARYHSALWSMLVQNGWTTVQVDDAGIAILMKGRIDVDACY